MDLGRRSRRWPDAQARMIAPPERSERWARILRFVVGFAAIAATGAWIVGSFAVAVVAEVDRGENQWGLFWLAVAGGSALGTCAGFALRGQSSLAVLGLVFGLVLFVVWLAVADSDRWELFWLALGAGAALAAGEGLWVRDHPRLAAYSAIVAVILLAIWLSVV